MRKLVLFVLAASLVCRAQDALVAAGEHYKLVFENPLVRVIRVSYQPHESSPIHDHPAIPTVFFYTTDGGLMRVSHDDGPAVDRKPVLAGQIRINKGAVERHRVDYLGDRPSQYLRVEMKTAPFDLPDRDVRLSPKEGYENGMIRIAREICPPEQLCDVQNRPLPYVFVLGTEASWVAPGIQNPVKNETGSAQPATVIEIKYKAADSQ